MKKTKVIKTTVYTEDYKKISAIASLNGHKIWEEIAIAIQNYINTFTFTSTLTLTPEPKPELKSEPEPEPEPEPEHIYIPPTKAVPVPTKPSKPIVEEFIEFLDREGVPVDDTSWELYEGIKKKVPQYEKLELITFDEAQTIRKERKRY